MRLKEWKVARRGERERDDNWRKTVREMYSCWWEGLSDRCGKLKSAGLLCESCLTGKHTKKKKLRTAVDQLLKRGQERSDGSYSRREKRKKKQGEEREQPTCYHTVFNKSVAATRGLHVHATAVQCLLGVCVTRKRAPIQKSSHSALSVSYGLQRGKSSRRPLPLKRIFTQGICADKSLHLSSINKFLVGHVHTNKCRFEIVSICLCPELWICYSPNIFGPGGGAEEWNKLNSDK